MLINKFKPQYYETIKSLQFHKLVKQMNENAEEWMGRVWLTAVECNYIEIHRKLKEQFIHGLNDNEMLVEIIRKLKKTKEDKNVTSEQVLAWAKGVEAKRAQSAIIKFSTKFSNISHFREVCRGMRGRVVHNVQQEPDQNQRRRRSD